MSAVFSDSPVSGRHPDVDPDRCCNYGGEEEEEVFAEDSGEMTPFDAAVAALEELVMTESFQEKQDDFFAKYRGEFDDSEENKFVYTEIHTQFVELMDKELSAKLAEAGVDTDAFLSSLQETHMSRDDLQGDLWDMLFSLVDFTAFKELMLAQPLPAQAVDCPLPTLNGSAGGVRPKSP